MIVAQGGAKRADNVSKPNLMRQDDIGVAFDHRDPARLSSRGPRQIGGVQEFALLKKRGFRAVQILRGRLANRGEVPFGLGKNPSAKANGSPLEVANREHEAAAKPLARHSGSVVGDRHQTRLLKQIQRKTRPLPLGNEPTALTGGVADLKSFHAVRSDQAAL